MDKNELLAKENCEVPDSYKFILAGNSEFTIENLNYGHNFQYQVQRAKPRNEEEAKQEEQDEKNHIRHKDTTYFVKIKEDYDWVYAGLLVIKGSTANFYTGKKGNYSASSDAVKGLLWALKFYGKPLKRPMIMYHHGRCARCGKPLTDAKSVSRGFGPYCYSIRLV